MGYLKKVFKHPIFCIFLFGICLLTERLMLLTTEDPGSTPVISNFYEHFQLLTVLFHPSGWVLGMHWNLLPGMYLWQNTSLGKKGFNFLRNSKLQFFNAGVSILLCSDLYSSATQPSHLVRQIKVFLKKNGPFPSSFSFIFGLLSKHHNTIF